jgi:HK97 family phage portal protein
MSCVRGADGSLVYRYLLPRGQSKDFQQSEVVHYRWLSDNSYEGQLPAELCSTSVALARKLDVAANVFWENSARPDGVIETQEEIPAEAAAKFREQWNAIYGGARKRGSTAILPKKTQFKPIESNSNEASQYMELRKSLLPECARVYGIPTTLLGDADMAKYSNVEQEFVTAHVFGLLPWQKRFEGAIDRSILRTYDNVIDGRHYCRLDSRALLRGDTQARVALYQFLFNCGAISPNELRDLEDLDLLENPAANETYMQLGFGKLGAANVQAPPADPAVPPQTQLPADTIDPEDVPSPAPEPANG